jgi:hypothetical protein
MSTRVPAKRVVWSTRASARPLIVTADFLIAATALPPAWPLWSPSINRTAKAVEDMADVAPLLRLNCCGLDVSQVSHMVAPKLFKRHQQALQAVPSMRII